MPIWTDITLRAIEDHADYVAPDGTAYPGWNKRDIPGLVEVEATPVPTDPDLVVMGYQVSEDHKQVWITRPRTAEDDRKDALAGIGRLERLETPRRIAEAMPDDAGGTAEGRAWLAANRIAIANIRAGL